MRRLMQGARSVGGQAVFLAASTGIAQALVALLYLIAARGTSPENLGAAASAVALGTAAVGFVDFGTNSHWVREIARGSMDTGELGRRVTGKILYTTGLGALWVGTVPLVAPESILWTAGPVMLGVMINQTSQVALRGAARGELVSIMVIADRSTAFLVFAVLAACGLRPDMVLWVCLTCGSIASASLGWALVGAHRRPRVSFNPRTNPWRGSGFYGVSTLSNSAQAFDLPVLAAVGGPAAAGLFGAVNRWTQPMSLLASAFSAASAPFVSRSSNIIEAWRHVRQAAWMPLSAIALSAGVAFAAPWLVPVLLGPEYAGSASTLQVLAFVSIFSIVSQPLMVVLQSLGHDRFAGITMGVVVIVQLALVVILGRAYGSVGAAYASLIIQMMLFVALAARVRSEYRRVQVRPLTSAERMD